MITPENLLYAKTHEWIHVETDSAGAKIATVGLSAFAIEALTDLVYIDLPQAGRRVTAGESFAEIESVKAVSDIYSPVEGEVVEVNTEIAQKLEQLSKDPYQAGWLVKIRVEDESGLGELMDYEAYRKECEKENAH
jgi:glycine cleavage system H protein